MIVLVEIVVGRMLIIVVMVLVIGKVMTVKGMW